MESRETLGGGKATGRLGAAEPSFSHREGAEVGAQGRDVQIILSVPFLLYTFPPPAVFIHDNACFEDGLRLCLQPLPTAQAAQGSQG